MLNKVMGYKPAFSENNIPLVLEFDNYYVPYAGVCIQSIIDSSKSCNNYDINIIEHGISNQNKELLQTLTNGVENFSMRFITPDTILNLLLPGCKSNNLWFRMMSPFAFTCYEKIIVLDLDIIVKQDIANLLKVDFGENCVAGVRDVMWAGQYEQNYMLTKHGVPYSISMHDYCKTTLTMQEPRNYYNSGVTVFHTYNSQKYVNGMDFLKILENDKFIFNCQDKVNLTYENRIKFLDLAWNFQVQVNSRFANHMSCAPEFLRKEYLVAEKEPYVIHWLGDPKPYVCPDVNMGYIWWETAMRTPFVPHTIARMIEALHVRREYYLRRYGEDVPVWDPVPDTINRDV